MTPPFATGFAAALAVVLIGAITMSKGEQDGDSHLRLDHATSRKRKRRQKKL